MKKLLLSAMIIAAAITSCSKKTADIDNNDGKVEIKLNSGIVVSKAALDNTSSLTGVVFHRVDRVGSGGPPNCYGTPGLTANRATNGDITFDVPQYYHATLPTFIVSYYPAGTVNQEDVDIAIDGKTDILCRPMTTISGTAAAPAPTTIEYQHTLAMVEVNCKAENGKDTEVQSRWGKVVGLKLKNTHPTMKVCLGTGFDFNHTGTPTTIALWNANFEAFAPITLTDANSAVQSRGMFAPNAGVLDLVITTQRDGGNPVDKELKITLPGAAEFKAGFKHLLTLTFKASLLEEIEVTSTIKDWEVGTGASGDVD